MAFVQVFITDKKEKEGKGKKNLSEELKGKLQSVLVSPPLQSPILGDLNWQVRALHCEACTECGALAVFCRFTSETDFDRRR